MITVTAPVGFEWNELNSQWVKNYLSKNTALLQKLTNGLGVDIVNLNYFQFQQICQLMEATAEGRELRNKMFKAWRSKKSRDSDNGKKLYTFNLSIKAGDHLKKIAKNNPINKTLEKLIFNSNFKEEPTPKYKETIKQLKIENNLLTKQLSDFAGKETNDEEEIQILIKKDLHVKELAELEKSQLIKQILLLKRKINHPI